MKESQVAWLELELPPVLTMNVKFLQYQLSGYRGKWDSREPFTYGGTRSWALTCLLHRGGPASVKTFKAVLNPWALK